MNPSTPSNPALTRSPSAPADTRSPGRDWGFFAICAGFFMVTLDGAALNLALPSIQHELQGTAAQLEWVVTAYTLPLAGLLLSAGVLGDRWGARRLFVASVLAFALTSLLCALSTSLPWLIAGRALQGVAAAGLLPMVATLIAKGYTDKTVRAKAVNTTAVVGGIAMVVGPLGGGWLTQTLGWRAIFLLNLPIGLLAAWLAWTRVAETTRRVAPLDGPGVLIGVLALVALEAGLIEGGSLGWASPAVLAMLVLGVVGLVGFVAWELRTPHPMLPLQVFRNTAFSAATLGGFAFQFGVYGMLFMLAVFVQTNWHFSALHAGMALLPFALALIATSMLLNPRLRHFGVRWMLWVGGLVATVGALLTLAVSTPESMPLFALGTVLVAVGAGIFSPGLNMVATTTIEPAFAGLASGIYYTARQIGMSFSIAILGGLASNAGLLGVRIGLLLIAGCFAGIVLIGLRYIRAE